MLLTGSVAVLGYQRSLIAFERDTANDARNRAEREATKAKAVNTFLQKTIGAGNPLDGVGRDVTVLEALQRSLATAEQEFSTDKEIDAAIRSTVGQTYFELGLYDEATPLLERAVETRRQLYQVATSTSPRACVESRRSAAIAVALGGRGGARAGRPRDRPEDGGRAAPSHPADSDGAGGHIQRKRKR